MDKVKFLDPDTGVSTELYVLEQTMVSGVNFLLVAEQEEGDSDAFLLREAPGADETESAYEMVEDERELQAVAKVFAELIEDVDIEF